MAIHYLHQAWTLRVEQMIHWRSFAASVIHGQISRRIFEASCPHRSPSCESCPVAPQCDFLLWDGPSRGHSPTQASTPTPPAPYRLALHPWEELASAPGRSLRLEVTLFGPAVAKASLIEWALRESFDEGMGAVGDSGRRGRAVVLALETSSGVLLPAPPPQAGTRTQEAEVLEFETPIRLLREGRVISAIRLEDVVKAASLRQRLFLRHFLAESPNLPPEPLQEPRWGSAESFVRRVPVSRFSARQRAAMRLDGIIGRIEIRDPSPGLLRLLEFVAIAGLGKNVSLGFGSIRLRSRGTPHEP